MPGVGIDNISLLEIVAFGGSDGASCHPDMMAPYAVNPTPLFGVPYWHRTELSLQGEVPSVWNIHTLR